MDSNERSKVIAFDTLFCTNHIQMLKVILPYMDNQTQKSLAIYIKFLELNYTIDYFKKHPYPLCGCMEKESSHDIFKMCTELLPYCTENEKKQIEQIRNVFQGMEMYKEMSKTMDVMKDFMPDMAGFMNFASETDAFAASGPDDSSPTSPTENRDISPEQAGNSPSGDNDPSNTAGSFDMMNLLMNMLTPEQKQMYEMFGGDHHAE